MIIAKPMLKTVHICVETMLNCHNISKCCSVKAQPWTGVEN